VGHCGVEISNTHAVNSVVSPLKGWKLRYSKMDIYSDILPVAIYV
jgi:hypothetical protein